MKFLLNIMKIRLAALVLIVSTASALAQTTAQPPLPTTTLRVGSHSITAEVADEDPERAAGLMFRESLADDHGMIFVMPAIEPASFWMKNTRIPLSIAFLEANGTIAEIHELEAFNEKVVRSTFPRIAYALEMPKGWFTKKNIWPGERITGLPPLPR